MTISKAAKNLLEGRSCMNCQFGYPGKLMGGVPFCINKQNEDFTYVDTPKNNTCEDWSLHEND